MLANYRGGYQVRASSFQLLALSLILWCHSAWGELPRNSPTAGSPLSVVISPSNTHLIKGSVYSINVDISNNSISPVDLNPNSIELEAQPEIAPEDDKCAYWYDPHWANSIKDGTTHFLMAPGDHLPIVFNMGEITNQKRNDPCYLTATGQWSKILDFIPGTYTFVFYGEVWTGAKNELTPNTRHFSQTAQLDVGIEQVQIILFAGIGGLLAYIVVSLRDGGDFRKFNQISSRPEALKQVGLICLNLPAAIILSVAVTIVANRLSDTQFPLKVSVNDAWGALTVGFVSYFVGGKFISKLAGTP